MLSNTLKKLVQPAKSAAAVLLLAVAVSIAIPSTSARLQWLAANLIILALWLVSSATTTSTQSSYPDIDVLPVVISSLYPPKPDLDNYTPDISPATDKFVDKLVVVEEKDTKPEAQNVADDEDEESMDATWKAIMRRTDGAVLPAVEEEKDTKPEEAKVADDDDESMDATWKAIMQRRTGGAVLPVVEEEEDTKPEAAKVADDDDESMDATWKAIMQRARGAIRPVTRKTETWGREETIRMERVAAEKAGAQKAMRKPATKKETSGGGGWRKREALVVPSDDELLRRVESTIRRHHENLLLQRQESEQRRLLELRGRSGNATNTYVPVRV